MSDEFRASGAVNVRDNRVRVRMIGGGVRSPLPPKKYGGRALKRVEKREWFANGELEQKENEPIAECGLLNRRERRSQRS